MLEKNEMEINFMNAYRSDGDGLHSFIDDVDKEQYLYTYLFPDKCNYVMPVFDQPDLRAFWTLKTVSPTDWNVVSNDLELVSSKADSDLVRSNLMGIAKDFGSNLNFLDHKVHSFHQSEKIATYLYAVIAGPYGSFEYKGNYTKVPMKIYGRKSILDSIRHEETFEVTVAGMKYYEDLFGKPYQFRKYDQIFVPESN